MHGSFWMGAWARAPALNLALAWTGYKPYMWSPKNATDRAPVPPPGLVITWMREILPKRVAASLAEKGDLYTLGAALYFPEKVSLPPKRGGDSFRTRLGRLLGYLCPLDLSLEPGFEQEWLWVRWGAVWPGTEEPVLLWAEGVPLSAPGLWRTASLLSTGRCGRSGASAPLWISRRWPPWGARTTPSAQWRLFSARRPRALGTARGLFPLRRVIAGGLAPEGQETGREPPP